MSNRHYWPTEPGEYLLEMRSGTVVLATLYSDTGMWYGERKSEDMHLDGYLGVRTPFSEEAERAAFEEHFKGKMYFDRDEDGEYVDWHTGFAWLGWLEAKRHERGL